jgi:hypothetical protein
MEAYTDNLRLSTHRLWSSLSNSVYRWSSGVKIGLEQKLMDLYMVSRVHLNDLNTDHWEVFKCLMGRRLLLEYQCQSKEYDIYTFTARDVYVLVLSLSL